MAFGALRRLAKLDGSSRSTWEHCNQPKARSERKVDMKGGFNQRHRPVSYISLEA